LIHKLLLGFWPKKKKTQNEVEKRNKCTRCQVGYLIRSPYKSLVNEVRKLTILAAGINFNKFAHGLPLISVNLPFFMPATRHLAREWECQWPTVTFCIRQPYINDTQAVRAEPVNILRRQPICLHADDFQRLSGFPHPYLGPVSLWLAVPRWIINSASLP